MGHCEQDRLWCAAGDCICTCNRCYVARFETRNEMNAKLAAAESRAERAEATVAKLTAERDYLRAWKAWAGGMAHRLLAANPEPQPPEGVAP